MAEELILIIEDNELNLKLAQEVLETYGYRTTGARDGLEGVELARQLRPRLILMDLHLPGIDGLEATRRLKADPRTREIPVYALTALDREENEKKAREAGCDGYITKPMQIAELIQRVKEALIAGSG